MQHQQSTRGFTLVEIMIVVAILGILAALAIPNFIRYQARSKQSEVKTNLKGVYTGQLAFFAARDRYTTFVGEVGLAPERGNRYRYELLAGCMEEEERSAEVAVLPATPPCAVGADTLRYGAAEFASSRLVDVANAGALMITPAHAGVMVSTVTAGVHPSVNQCPECAFIVRAVGQIDNDVGDDEWFITSESLAIDAALCAESLVAGAGSPANSRNDVNCD